MSTVIPCLKDAQKVCEAGGQVPRYRCEVGQVVGLDADNLAQAQRICDMFPHVPGCLAEQACNAYFPQATPMYQACHQTVTCLQAETDQP